MLRGVSAPISFIDPNIDPATRTARVRVVLPNPQRRIFYRQTADGAVRLETPPVLQIPRSAVLQTRGKPVAYVVKTSGGYEPRTLTLGRVGDDTVEILGGVREGERVVSQAALLIDNQAQLEGLETAPTGSADAHAHANANAKVTGSERAGETPTLPVHAAAPALLPAIFAATEALAADDLAAYARALPALKRAVAAAGGSAAALVPLAEKLTATPDLKTARRPFEPFSNAAADLVRARPEATRGASIFQCRMSPVLGTARWLQRGGTTIRNPFFGAEMLECGEALK
jgi:Cu(I)/Ag(I) efflux system membrane fusion protein